MSYNQYEPAMRSLMKYQFNGIEKLDTSYSQMHQDMFLLCVLNGKTNGKYLEIGGHHPIEVNNTYLLETKFNWTGVSVDLDQQWVEPFSSYRKNKLIIGDATKLDYDDILTTNGIGLDLDYMSVDVDPPMGTFRALKQALSGKIKSKVITFEHSAMLDGEGQQARMEGRKLLEDLGYMMIVKNVSNIGVSAHDLGTAYPVEDWWVDPAQVDMSIVEKLKSVDTDFIASYHTVYKGSIRMPSGHFFNSNNQVTTLPTHLY